MHVGVGKREKEGGRERGESTLVALGPSETSENPVQVSRALGVCSVEAPWQAR